MAPFAAPLVLAYATSCCSHGYRHIGATTQYSGLYSFTVALSANKFNSAFGNLAQKVAKSTELRLPNSLLMLSNPAVALF